jgi:hypothetical protein
MGITAWVLIGIPVQGTVTPMAVRGTEKSLPNLERLFQ